MLWWRRKAFNDYQNRLTLLKNSSRASGLTDDEIEKTFKESIMYLKRSMGQLPERASTRTNWRYIIVSVIIIFGTCYCLNFYKPLHNFVERNIQGVIYPFMTSYRRFTLPIVKNFPFVTELYDESCLLENPYFKVSDIECWPCENARVVLNLSESLSKAHVGLPFVIKVSQPPVSFNDLRNGYLTNKALIDDNSGKITSNQQWQKISEVFANLNSISDHPDAHIIWRINRMETGRVLRTLLKPPQGLDVPTYASSLGIERFVLVDGPTAPQYPLPSTEGANVFVKQLSGQRLLVLEPSPECRGPCRRLSILLEEQHILWYNWWYWRPRSLPVQNVSSISVAFMGSSV